MSEEFYKYISNKLINFFINEPIKTGDKYFIEFDDKIQVQSLYSHLKDEAQLNNLSYGTFEYTYEDGNPFITYYINVKKDLKLVVANSSSVTMDYLVTLRNAVIEQKDIWKNTFLLIIGHDINDSIQNGMRDLQTEGMPLHFKTIYNNLINEIYDKNNNISKVDREIIKFDIESKVNNIYERNIWDYEDTLGLINKGKVDIVDLEEMKLFPDPGLDETLRTNSIQNRLIKNHDLFVMVESLQNYDDKRERLSKKFDTSCTNKLSSKNWKETEYTYIKQHDTVEDGSLEYIESDEKITETGLEYWERPTNHNKTGLRKRNIIIFNTKESNLVEINFEFDKRLNKNYLVDKKSQKITMVKGKKLIVNIETSPYKTTFARVVYKHLNLTKLRYEFNIAIVNCDKSLFEPIKSDYLISTTTTLKSIEIINEDTSTPVVIGSGENKIKEEIEENGQVLNIDNETTIEISEESPAWSLEEKLYFNLNYNSFKIPITIKEERDRAIPTSSLNIWNLKRQNELNFKYNGSKVTQSVNSFYITDDFKKILSYERQIILNNIYHGTIDINDNIKEIPLNISDSLKMKYNYIIQYYKNMEPDEDNCGYPSLCYLDSDLEKLYEDFLNEYNKEIENIEENKPLSSNKEKYDINKIGLFKTNNRIYYSSLSPINMAYQLEVKKQLRNEKMDINILSRINDENLVPFIYKNNNKIFKPITQNIAKEWIIYEKEEEVSIGSTNQFISKVIEQKIGEFVDNFNYLFIKSSKAPIKINIINIKQDKEIVKGVFNFLYKQIIKGKEIIPIELNLYNNGDKSFFDDFFSCEDDDELNSVFNLKIKSSNIDKNDILHMIQNNITYYKNEKSSYNDYEYAHISFYKLGEETRTANHNMSKIETGLSLNGILSDPTAFNSDSGYRIGFGSKGLLYPHSTLVRTTINTNELIQNTKNNGEDSYIKNHCIVSKPTEPNEEDIEKLYDKSLWVTFIEPSFGLEYFDNRKNLIIIHYSDQYTSSNKYDTITVTNKNKQYKNILKRFLESKDVPSTDEKLNNVIKIFNGINGEWLLRIINDDNHTNREKLSIISAIKNIYGLLNHHNVVWIPISMQEILRIAGTVGLSKNEGLFKKSLLQGRFSDDLLFVGINIQENSINVYYHPIEVKQGIIPTSTITKAEEQLFNTINLINTQFIDREDNAFKSKFYRNFFMQLALANLNKLKNLDFWSERKIKEIEEAKPFLLNDKYKVSDDLTPYIGEGSVIAFNKNRTECLVTYEDNIQIVEVPEEFAYNSLTKSIKEICDTIQNRSEFKEKDLLSNKIEENNQIFVGTTLPIQQTTEREPISGTVNYPIDKPDIIHHTSEEKEQEVSEENSIITLGNNEESTSTKDNEKSTIGNDNEKQENNKEKTKLENVRALIGTVPHGNKKIYWEYGNPQLSNRHLLILGKSGYGKTYFMQCLIKEMSKNDIPTLIIDYSDAFMTAEIQDDLKEYLGQDLIKYNVKMSKFPLNPFRKNKLEFDGDFIDEDNLDIASRIKSVFSSVYNIGIVQENTLVKAINNGLIKHGTEMSFDYLMEELDDSENKNAISVLNQLNEFLMYNPFEQESTFEWSELDSRNKKVIIIQLHGYSRDIQKIITEFILWDLWNYKSLHGTSEKPFNVILDEAQNLDYSDNSPCVKILKEGRKKGWSVWFATQSIKGMLKNAEVNPFNNANQIVYFNPADNVKNVASEFTTNNQDKIYWAEKLKDLKKGECITVGATKNLEGNLKAPEPNYVSINALEER